MGFCLSLGRGKTMQLFQSSPIYVITDECQSCGRSNKQIVHAALTAGVKFIQYREKKKTLKDMYTEGLELRAITHKYNAALIVDDYIALALAIGADGVHIGQDDLPPVACREIVGSNIVIGFSTHNEKQLEEATDLYKTGIIDYIGAGPVYPTKTKENPAPVTGLDYIKTVAKNKLLTGLPFVAIGGIKEHNISSVAQAGATNIAVVSDITTAADIPAKIAALTKSMQ